MVLKPLTTVPVRVLRCRRALTAVYQLHAAAINALVLGEGVALTASDDTTLRLWPLDFSSCLMEAEHESPLTSACLAARGGLVVVAGGEDGCLGRLDVLRRQHTCLLRAHTGGVAAIAAHPTK
jgi:WD40 repeat protein